MPDTLHLGEMSAAVGVNSQNSELSPEEFRNAGVALAGAVLRADPAVRTYPDNDRDELSELMMQLGLIKDPEAKPSLLRGREIVA